MYYASFISLYWPYLQLLPFFAGSGGCSKLVLASIKALDCSMFQQHKTFLTRHISLVKAFKWNPVLTRFIITKQRDFDKKSRWYIEKRSSHFSHLKSTHCETALRVWRRRTKRCFPSLLPQAWCAWCELTSRSWCTPSSIWSLNCLHFLCYPGVHNYVYTCAYVNKRCSLTWVITSPPWCAWCEHVPVYTDFYLKYLKLTYFSIMVWMLYPPLGTILLLQTHHPPKPLSGLKFKTGKL